MCSKEHKITHFQILYLYKKCIKDHFWLVLQNISLLKFNFFNISVIILRKISWSWPAVNACSGSLQISSGDNRTNIRQHFPPNSVSESNCNWIFSVIRLHSPEWYKKYFFWTNIVVDNKKISWHVFCNDEPEWSLTPLSTNFS